MPAWRVRQTLEMTMVQRRTRTDGQWIEMITHRSVWVQVKRGVIMVIVDNR